MREALFLSGALVCAVAGMGWLALAMETHWEQVRRDVAWTAGTARRLRMLGWLGIAGSLVLCLAADHASMASLVWFMLLAAAAALVAMALAWRPGVLRVMWPVRPS